MAKVTLEQLRALGACKYQRDKFEELFSDKVEVTLKLCVKHSQKFDWAWAADNLLGPKGQAEYEAKRVPILAEYEAKHTPILAEYRAKHTPIYAEYKAKSEPLWAVYEIKFAPIHAEYAAKHASIFAEYNLKLAVIFYKAFEGYQNA